VTLAILRQAYPEYEPGRPIDRGYAAKVERLTAHFLQVHFPVLAAGVTADGRMLLALGLEFYTHRVRTHKPGAMVIWFTTAAGYEARILLPERPPLATLTAVIFADNDVPHCAEVRLNGRARAALARGQRAVA